MLPDRFSAFIRWWVNTSSRSSAYSSKDVRSIHRSWICSSSSSSYKTSKIICVPHVTPVNSPAVLHLTILKSWPCHAKTTRKLPSTAPATKIQPYDSAILKSWPCHAKTTRKLQSTAPARKIQPYDSEVVALPRESNLKVTKYCTCHKIPTLRSLWLKKHKKKCKS